MHKRTDLAADTISGSDRLVVQLIEAADLPPIVAISWPVGRLCVTRTGSPIQRLPWRGWWPERAPNWPESSRGC